MKTKLASLLAVATFTASQVHAATITASQNFSLGTTTAPTGTDKLYTFTSTTLNNFDATVGDDRKLVAVFMGENLYGIDSLTYGGSAMTQIEYFNSLGSIGVNGRYVGIFYLDNPTSNGSLIFDLDDSATLANGIGGTLFLLTGVASGTAATSAANTGTTTTLTLAQEAIVLAGSVKNNQSVLLGNFSNGMTTNFSGDTGSSAGATGSLAEVAAGSFSTSSTNAEAIASAAFYAIPEPSTALLGFVGLAVLFRRRRG